VPLHGRARPAVLVQRDRHRGAAGPLRRLARVHRSRRHLLHKVRARKNAGFVLISRKCRPWFMAICSEAAS
jgi:hypothetical protein